MDRILIAYVSKTGTTSEIAAKMGEALSQKNLAVDVLPVNKVGDLSAYRAVVLGSAIRIGQILPDAMKFIQNNQAALQQKPFNSFVVCMTLKDDTPENRATVAAYLDPVRALVKPASEGLFAGAVNPKRMSLFERLIMKGMKVPEGDFRQWDQINAWVGQVVLA